VKLNATAIAIKTNVEHFTAAPSMPSAVLLL
jgi:hypothetical protein